MPEKKGIVQQGLRSTPSSRTRDKCRPYLFPGVLLAVIIVAGGFLVYSRFFDASNFGLTHIAIAISIIAFGSTVYEALRSSHNDKLTATLQILAKLGSEDFRRTRNKVTRGSINWDEEDNPLEGEENEDKLKIRQLMAEFNQTGLLVSRNLIDKWMVLDLYHYIIIGLWEKLECPIRSKRKKDDFPYYMVHFEGLYKASREWAKNEKTMHLKTT